MTEQGQDISESLLDRVKLALGENQSLNLIGGNSKHFYGASVLGQDCQVSSHRGILAYEPTELTITARGGTRLTVIESALAEHQQMLPFEPPHYGSTATLAGAVASGLSGPRRPYSGAVRDNILGVKIINGLGQVATFGGQVMKNVAGYDVSRLMAAAMGTLGLILEVSIKVIPKPESEMTISYECNFDQAIVKANQLSNRPLPISASSADGQFLHLRVAASESSIASVLTDFGGDLDPSGDTHWNSILEQSHPFFDSDSPLWRIVVPPATPMLPINGEWLIDWGGGQRWLKSQTSRHEIFKICQEHHGHACLYRGGDHNGDIFQPLPAALFTLQNKIKNAFDPHHIFNPGRMYQFEKDC